MNYSTNYNLNKPERNEQFNLDDWNNNTDAIDTAMNTNKTNIANNASNISTILTGLSTVNTSDTNSVYYKLMKLIYPVGSLYWSSKSTNPASLFGGTWVQIKDRFVLACGDTYTSSGATGGASTVTLSFSNMPSHSHSFSPSGEVTSTFEGTAVNTGGMSAKSSGSFKVLNYANNTRSGVVTGVDGSVFTDDKSTNSSNTSRYWGSGDNACYGSNNWYGYHTINMNVNHTHTVTAKGTVSSSFRGYEGTTSPEGSGSAFSILPPYVVKYCWERTA